jgi:uncharacterized protein (TIGR01777 family)
MRPMNIFITGGTGFVGSNLATRFSAQGHKVTILTRSIREGGSSPEGVSFLQGDPVEKGSWQKRVSEHEIIINLAGASIFSLWTKRRKRMIRDSRVKTTLNLVEALSDRKGKETLLLSTSAVGYYGFHGDEALDESSAPGNDFLASVTREWETTALKAQTFGARVVLCRFGIVLGSNGGALSRMMLPIKWYLGSSLGNGRQWFSWIHEQDLADIIIYLIEQENLSGPINCTAPYPVTNRDMTTAMAEALNRPVLLPPVPAFVLKLILGEFASTLVCGQKVLPKKLLNMGFRFRFPNIQDALNDLL